MIGGRLTALVVALGAVLAAPGVTGQAQAAGYRYWSFWQTGGSGWAYATQGPATARPADGTVDGYRFSVSADSQDASKPRSAPSFPELCADTPARPGAKRVGVVIDFGTGADAPAGEKPPSAQASGCASLPADATSAEALAAVAGPLRYDSAALLCAISGYPATGCGEQVSAGERASAEPGASSPSAGQGPEGGSGAGADEAGATGAGADGAGADGAGAAAGKDTGEDTGEGATAAEGAEEGPSLGLFAGVAAVLALGGAAFWQSRRRG
ncbi:SCO2322 family protein [Streptomyces spongiicola]|uniref:SCO2322 family protein n=1 Tax=Streptomyces spongiicola TaxID=1690221 RepID=UPI00340B6CA2